MFEAGEIFTQKEDDLGHLFPADEFGPGEVVGAGAVDSGDIRHVDADLPRQPGRIDQHMAGRSGQMLPGQRLNLPLRHIEQVFEAARQLCPGVIDAADTEHQRHRLAEGIPFAPELELRPGTRRDIAVTGRVNDDFSHQSLPTGFAFRDDAAHRPAVADGIADEGVESQPDSGFGQHIQQHLFQEFVTDLVPSGPLCGAEDARLLTPHPLHHLIEQR